MVDMWAVAAAGNKWQSHELFLGLFFVAARDRDQALLRGQIAGATVFQAHIIETVAAPMPGLWAMEAVPVPDPSWEDMT